MNFTAVVAMTIFVLVMLVIVLFNVGARGKVSKQCANSAHEEWTEKDDDLACKPAWPKPVKRVLQYFLDHGLTTDQKKGKAHVPRYCQRCANIARRLVDEQVKHFIIGLSRYQNFKI